MDEEEKNRAMRKALINEIIRMLCYTDDMEMIDLVYVLLLKNDKKILDSK